MPAWVDAGVAEYSKRLPAEFALQLSDVPLGRRGKGQDVEQAVRKEAEALLARVRPQEHVVALEVTGLRVSTEALAQRLDAIRRDGRNLVLLGWRRPERFRLVALGVTAEHRRRGIEGMMFAETLAAARRLGFRRCEASWILEDNRAVQQMVAIFEGSEVQRYRIYERPI